MERRAAEFDPRAAFAFPDHRQKNAGSPGNIFPLTAVHAGSFRLREFPARTRFAPRAPKTDLRKFESPPGTPIALRICGAKRSESKTLTNKNQNGGMNEQRT
jgi:hypothetical protein